MLSTIVTSIKEWLVLSEWTPTVSGESKTWYNDLNEIFKIQRCRRKGEGFMIAEDWTNRNQCRNGQDVFHWQKKPASMQKADCVHWSQKMQSENQSKDFGLTLETRKSCGSIRKTVLEGGESRCGGQTNLKERIGWQGDNEEDIYWIQVKRRSNTQRKKRNTKIFWRKQREEINKPKGQKALSTWRELRWLYGWIKAGKDEDEIWLHNTRSNCWTHQWKKQWLKVTICGQW